MKQRDFDRLLATYGADLRRWPTLQRPGARTLLEVSPMARERLADIRRFDATLDLAAPAIAVERIDAVVARAMAAVRTQPQAQEVAPLLPGLRAATARWLSAGVLSGAIAAGFAFGFVLHSPGASSTPGAAEEAESTAASLVFARSLSLYAEAE